MPRLPCLAIIPAKGYSSGVPNKNIKKINKIETIAITILAAKKCKLIDHVYVTSDSEKILKIAKKYRAFAIKRPKKLCKNSTSLEEVVNHAIIKKIKKNFSNFNIVLLQPTSILREKNDLTNAIKKYKKNKYDSLFSAVNIHPLFWEEYKNKIKPINYNLKKRKNRQVMSKYLIENGSFYIFNDKSFEKYNNRLGGKIGYYLMSNFSIHEIDEQQDLKFMKIIYTNKSKKILNII